jgi:hypothetical protein
VSKQTTILAGGLVTSLAMCGVLMLNTASPSGALQNPTAQAEHDPHAQHGVVEAMSGDHHHGAHDPHMKFTAARPPTDADQRRADAIVGTLRNALEKYKDADVAIKDGYQPFLPNLPLPEHHFTNYRNGFLEAFTFSPARPTSLLYRRKGGEYTLVGAMYTAPKRATEDQLHSRVPLNIATWHAHVNICMPARGTPKPDWTLFGLKGSIATSEACKEAGGRFFPQLFGWMVHVYPYEEDPARIWMHGAAATPRR